MTAIGPITVTTTAMPRPELLERTYRSFCDRMARCDFGRAHLIINVDPFPDDLAQGLREQCIEIAKRYFSVVSPRLPAIPNFALAVKYLWESASTDIVFNLEDDWELLEPVDFEGLVGQMKSHGASHLMLRAWRSSRYKFCLGPGLIRKPLYKLCADRLAPTTNPEMTIRSALANIEYTSTVFPQEHDRVVVKDIGRMWMRTAGYVRGGGDFIAWSKETPENSSEHDRLADQNRELTPGG